MKKCLTVTKLHTISYFINGFDSKWKKKIIKTITVTAFARFSVLFNCILSERKIVFVYKVSNEIT